MMNKKIDEIIRYLFSAGSSFVLDLILFTIFNYFFSIFMGNLSIIISTIIARIISSFYNYFINSRFVFKNYNKKTIFKYYVLVVIQMGVSSLSVYLINNVININTTLIKSIVDVVIFIANYIIQKTLVFK